MTANSRSNCQGLFRVIEPYFCKGVVYLGAVQALQALASNDSTILPINIDKPHQNQLVGISGSSAGAITALMLAMGMNHEELLDLLNQKEEFRRFFDRPKSGFFRGVDAKFNPIEQEDTIHINHMEQFPGKLIKAAYATIKMACLKPYFSKPGYEDILNMIDTDIVSYVYNLYYDRGLFPGFAARSFLQKCISDRLDSRLRKKNLPGQRGTINFLTFFELTGVNLIITGTNITLGEPRYFSATLTPEFPVAEAVGISMSIPFLFKPVWVEAPEKGVTPKNYRGFWVDGGTLNNLPIHAFDDLTKVSKGSKPDPNVDSNLIQLNPNVLALRLTEGTKGQESKKQIAIDRSPMPSFGLDSYIGAILDTLLYPSEEGQLRTQSERDQTIDLYTYDLSLVDFSPKDAQCSTPIDQAKLSVLNNFGKAPN